MEFDLFQYHGESPKEVIASNFLGNIIMAHISWNFSSPNFSTNSISHSFQFKIKLVSKIDYFSSQTCPWLEFFSFKCSKASWRVSFLENCLKVLFVCFAQIWCCEILSSPVEFLILSLPRNLVGVPSRMKIRVNMKKLSFWNKAWVLLVFWASMTSAKM